MKFIESFVLFENVNQAKSILKSIGKDATDSTYLEIRKILKGHDGYVGWFTNLHYKFGYSLNNLIELLDIIKSNAGYLGRLPKQLLKYDNIESLQDDIESIKIESSYNRILGEFPNEQSRLLNDSDKQLLQSLSTRRDSKSFFRKISSYHNRKDLIDALKKFLSVDPNSSLDKTMEKAIDSGSKVEYFSYEDNILIVRVYNSTQLNKIAADCSWCIRNQGTFDSYVTSKSKQFIIFLFDRIDSLSRIGFTARIGSSNFYYTAHDKNDTRVSYESLSKILNEYNVDVKDISSFSLDDININDTSVKDLINDFKLTKDEIINLKSRFTKKDINQFTKDEIDKWNLLDKSEIDTNVLLKYSFDEVVSKKLINRLSDISLYSIISMFDKYGFEVIDLIKKDKSLIKSISSSNNYGYKQGVSDGDFFKSMISDSLPYDLEVGNYWSDRDNGYSYDKTMVRILWFKDEIKSRLDSGRLRVSDLFVRDSDSLIVKLLYRIGVSKEDISSLLNDKSFDIDYYTELVSCLKEDGLDYSDIVDDFYKRAKENIGDNIERYKSTNLLSNDQIKKLENISLDRQFIRDIPRSGYSREMTKSYGLNFYNKWKDQIADRIKIFDGRYFTQ